MPCYAIIDASKRVHCFAIADVKLLLAYAIEMTELIDMFEMTELIDMFVLCLRFLLCYAIAYLKQEREESRREREAASNAACIIVARIAVARCKLYLSNHCLIKSFYDKSVLELDAVHNF